MTATDDVSLDLADDALDIGLADLQTKIISEDHLEAQAHSKALPDGSYPPPPPAKYELPEDQDTTFDGAPRCTAQSKQHGRRCLRAAKPGTNVCVKHGSGNPNVKRKAALRLASLVDPAIGVLAREMASAPKSSDRQRAANSVLDRAGFGRATKVETTDARALLAERLMELAASPQEHVEPDETLDGEIESETEETETDYTEESTG